MSKDDQGISNTVVNNNWSIKGYNKQGVVLEVKTPYETNLVQIDFKTLKDMADKQDMVEAKFKAAERQKGDEKRWYGQSL